MSVRVGIRIRVRVRVRVRFGVRVRVSETSVRLSAACRITSLPTLVEPTKVILSHDAVSASPVAA